MRSATLLRILAISSAIFIGSAACAGEQSASDAPRPGGGEERVSERIGAEADAALAICLQGAPFVGQGRVPMRDADGGDATRIRQLRWDRHDGCERFVIDLGSNGEAAASVGRVQAEVLRDLGLVRVTLPGVRRVEPDATDATFDGPLARAAYAVWAPDGESTFVDLHLARPAEVHASVLEDPARVVMDLRPGGGSLPPPAVSGPRVVVLGPRPGEASFPLRVTGYARTFEATVVVRLEQQGREALETFTTATAWVDAWGHFDLTLPEGPTGPVRLHVGEYSARDGSWEGVTVDLVVG
jgi:hypothetical protein